MNDEGSSSANFFEGVLNGKRYCIELERVRENDSDFKILVWRKSNIGTEGTKALANALLSNTSLTEINLSYSGVHMEALTNALAYNKSVVKIFLDNNNIGDEGGKAIAKAFKKNVSLTEINLDKNNIGEEGAKVLAKALITNTYLNTIYLRGNGIDDEGGKAMAEVLATNTSLTKMYLDDNNINKEGGKALGEALKKNKTLTTIHLGGNSIGDEGGKAMAKVLAINKTLTEVNLDKNNIGEEGAKAIQRALDTNTSLTTINLDGNNISGDVRQSIMSITDANTKLKQHRNKVKVCDPQLSFYVQGFPAPDKDWKWTAEAWDAARSADGRTVQVINECIQHESMSPESHEALETLFESKEVLQGPTMRDTLARQTNPSAKKLLQHFEVEVKDDPHIEVKPYPEPKSDIEVKPYFEHEPKPDIEVEPYPGPKPNPEPELVYDMEVNSYPGPNPNPEPELDPPIEFKPYAGPQPNPEPELEHPIEVKPHPDLDPDRYPNPNPEIGPNVGLYLKRYIIEGGKGIQSQPYHLSKTCAVHFATDIKKLVDDRHHRVVIKIMFNWEDFNIELHTRLVDKFDTHSDIDISQGLNKYESDDRVAVPPLLRYHDDARYTKGDRCRCLVFVNETTGMPQIIDDGWAVARRDSEEEGPKSDENSKLVFVNETKGIPQIIDDGCAVARRDSEEEGPKLDELTKRHPVVSATIESNLDEMVPPDPEQDGCRDRIKELEDRLASLNDEIAIRETNKKHLEDSIRMLDHGGHQLADVQIYEKNESRVLREAFQKLITDSVENARIQEKRFRVQKERYESEYSDNKKRIRQLLKGLDEKGEIEKDLRSAIKNFKREKRANFDQ